MMSSALTTGHDAPPGMTASRLSQPPRMPPPCLSTSSRKVMPIASSTVQGVFTWPTSMNSLVPTLLGRPKDENQAAPRRRMVGATAIEFDIVDRRRAAVEAHIGRKRRLQARLALLALEAFQQRRLFAADIGAGAVMDVDVEIVAVLVVLADQPGVIGLVDRALQRLALADELAAHIDVGRDRAHGEAGDAGSLRPACADRGAGCRGPCRCRARTRRH